MGRPNRCHKGVWIIIIIIIYIWSWSIKILTKLWFVASFVDCSSDGWRRVRDCWPSFPAHLDSLLLVLSALSLWSLTISPAPPPTPNGWEHISLRPCSSSLSSFEPECVCGASTWMGNPTLPGLSSHTPDNEWPWRKALALSQAEIFTSFPPTISPITFPFLFKRKSRPQFQVTALGHSKISTKGASALAL